LQFNNVRSFFYFFSATVLLLLCLTHSTDVKAEEINRTMNFSDVHNTFWAKDEVTQLVDLKVINGYPDGQFRPSVNVSRGQAANLLTGALKLPNAPYKPVFTDVTAQSNHLTGVMATYEAGIFNGKPDGTFGVGDVLTREQMASVIVQAFDLKDTGEDIAFSDWHRISESHKYGVKVLAQHGITTGKEDGTFDPKTPVNRATFVVFLHRALVTSGQIVPIKEVTFDEAKTSGNFESKREEHFFTSLPIEEDVRTFIRSKLPIRFMNKETTQYPYAQDTTFNYRVSNSSAMLEVTKRSLPNGDFFLFTELKNPSTQTVQIDIVREEKNIVSSKISRYDRYPIKKNEDDIFGYDPTTYPTGLLEKVDSSGKIEQEMIGQAYRSKDLKITYPTGGESSTRELLQEKEAFSSIHMGKTIYSFHTVKSNGYDTVDQWFMDSESMLFKSSTNMEDWMKESAINYRKRNTWYTANGPYNKMAVTVEPMPTSYKGYGRLLLLMKEDRALTLFLETKEPYFENLIVNSFVNLQKFKGEKTYWETEVTSTYLKNLYGITAPFIDTRFNEQIALFLYTSGKEMNDPNYNIPLKNYADLLVSQKSKGNIISVDSSSYYISDYFPLVQSTVTHSSMNHVLGGMNILLTSYQEFGDQKYLNTALSIQNAIRKEKNKWIRSDGDIWYRLNKQGEFAGRDYTHLTLEDLINSYKLWKDVDPSQLPTLEAYIRSKAGYLDRNNLGYTTKIKNGLEDIGMSELLPRGPEYTDAL